MHVIPSAQPLLWTIVLIDAQIWRPAGSIRSSKGMARQLFWVTYLFLVC